VAKALADSGLEPDRLEIEITEGVLVQNAAEALKTLKRLKALGIQIAMDDFGTGYSSLSYLQRFPFDKIKIDKSFVAGLRAESGAIVRAIVGLSRSLGMQTCAEGVETVEQLDLLRREGCEQVQGYLFGRAMNAAAIDALLHGNLQTIGAGQLRQYLLESPPRGKAMPQDGADQGEQAHSL
jgi:EAL domain-containing protein (putative c-di-GMP-specific phosphodiesterase class I)